MPPASQHAEHDMKGDFGTDELHQRDQAPWRRQFSKMLKRTANVCRGVHHIRPQHQVELSRDESLLGWVALEVEDMTLQERKLSELHLSRPHELRRHVGKHIFRTFRRQQRKKQGGQTTGSASDFEDAK